jgi:hypothetical protein
LGEGRSGARWRPYLAVAAVAFVLTLPAMLSPVKLHDSFWIDWVWTDQFADQLRTGVPKDAGALGAALRRDGGMAGLLQHEREGVAHVRIVVDDQNRCHRMPDIAAGNGKLILNPRDLETCQNVEDGCSSDDYP